MGQLQAQPCAVAIQAALYNLRMLRAGYLYVRIEYEGLYPEWSSYVVHPHGYLMEFNVRHPQDARANPACEVEIRGANASMVWVRDAASVVSLHYMFHPDPLDYQHLRQEIEPNRDKYMQTFDVAAWAKGSTRQKDTLQPGQLNGQVVEFAALSDAKLRDAMEGQFFGLMGSNAQEREWGDYEVAKHGRRFGQNAGGAATGQAVGPYIEPVLQLPYHVAHGPRLKNIAQLLADKKGAVVACHDAIGIAQSLAMSHPMASAPYELWLHSAPDKPVSDYPNVSNGWLLTTQGAIDQLLGAMKAGLLAAQSARIDALRREREAVASGAIPVPGGYVPGPDGRVRYRSADEARQDRLRDLDQQIARKELTQGEGGGPDVEQTLTEARGLVNWKTVREFEAAHKPHRDALDKRLDALSADTIAWLDSQAMLRALDCYNGKSVRDRGSDGARFALQLSVALINLDSSATGRQFLGKVNPFSFARKNLVARMVGCNDPAVTGELQGACTRLQTSADAIAASGPGRDPDEAHLKKLDAVSKEMSAWTEVSPSAEQIGQLYGKLPANLTGMLQLGRAMATAIKTVAGAGWSTAVFAAVTVFAASGKAQNVGGTLLAAEALLLRHGLGSKAAELLKQDALALAEKLKANPNFGKVGLGRAKDWLKKEQDIQNALNKHVDEAAKGQGPLGLLRSRGLLSLAQGLGALTLGGKAMVKQDTRSALEAGSQLASAVGSYRDIRATLCEEMVFKTVVPDEGQVAAFVRGTKLDAVTSKELLKLRAAAGRFTIAGSTVLVGLDLFDAARAGKEGNLYLTTAFIARAVGSGFAIAGVGTAMTTLKCVRLVAGLNIAGLVVIGVSTFAIEMLKDKEWQAWFKAQPFHIDKYVSDGTLVDKALQPTPFKSQSQMMSRLDEALTEAKGE
ncbi:MAG: hypothetical protein DI563_17150 [Variovorax paradoxus]|uniref:Toxin VasX N-terminal region domain-containing protein n=1 Tax=Variovorax paradoxus TaxID=34073 RepID=A0A2W5RWC0_VARPD|nr:MAG: hypothetical protein DI563_17150 [Variovorax paradoxus]